jgi:2-methylisocitrate lyase-like PEP mutase family enzyme
LLAQIFTSPHGKGKALSLFDIVNQKNARGAEALGRKAVISSGFDGAAAQD